MIRKRGKTVAKLLRELKGVGEKTEKLFQKIGITTTDDLLHYYPRNYDSYEAPEEIGSLKENSVVSVRGTVTAGVYVTGSVIFSDLHHCGRYHRKTSCGMV
mgnify:CR=1 FL=1